MSDKPFKSAEDAIRWMTRGCRTCARWGDCEIVRYLIFAYVRLNGDVPYNIAMRMGYDGSGETKCTEFQLK